MIKNVLNKKTKTITSAAFLLGLATLASRFLGLLRDHLLARTFGAGDLLDAYYTSFRVPDFIYAIFILGVISAVFIPVFSEYWNRDEQEAWDMVNIFINLVMIVLIVVSLIFIIFTPQLIRLIAPGFSADKQHLTSNITRIMFLSPLVLGISSIFASVLQALRKFYVFAFAPLLYNIGIIIGILFFVPLFGVYGLAYGVVLGALFQLILQFIIVKHSGFSWKPLLDLKHKGVRKIVKMMLPRVASLSANQINLIVITAFASTMAVGSVAIFNLANNLYWVVIGVAGVSFAMAAMPTLSDNFARGDMEEYHSNFSSSFRQMLFLIIPLSLLFFLLRAQIVRVVLGAGKFDWNDTRLTAACLGIFCFGMLACALNLLFVRSFCAMHDTKTPAIMETLAVVVNISLDFLFIYLFKNSFWMQQIFSKVLSLEGVVHIEIIALPLAFIIGDIVNLALFIWIFHRKTKSFKTKEIFSSFARVTLASLFMGGVVYNTIYYIEKVLDTRTFVGIFLQGAIAGGIGMLVYLGMCYVLNVREIKGLIAQVKGRFL